MNQAPHAYLLTFRTYGTWLHGDSRGSVQHQLARAPGSPVLASNHRWRRYARETMTHEPALLSPDARRLVHLAIVEVCEHRAWNLLALNARTNHVHAVLGAGEPPARVMATFKAWSTRRLREGGAAQPDERVWSRHGSTRYLWSEDRVQRAVKYVKEWQD
jgi:REP element-mobilizing transposase RayT